MGYDQTETDDVRAVARDANHTAGRTARELDELHAAIGEHQELLHELRKFVTPALTPDGEAEDGMALASDMAAVSPITERTMEATARVRSASGEVRDLLARLEL